MFKQSNSVMYIGKFVYNAFLVSVQSLQVLVSSPYSQKIEIQAKAFRMTKCIRMS